jgi:hypothetical protein
LQEEQLSIVTATELEYENVACDLDREAVEENKCESNVNGTLRIFAFRLKLNPKLITAFKLLILLIEMLSRSKPLAC